MIYQFTFLRHGESVGNRDQYIQGQQDFPLSPTGIEQADRLAKQWAFLGFHFDIIITSPLQRASSTAEIIQSTIQAPIIKDPVWMERHRGIHQGVTHQDLEKKFPRPPSIQVYDALGETGESEWQLYHRAGAALQSLFRYPPGLYLIVSHGALLNKVLHAIFGIKLEANFQGLHFELTNTAYTRIEYCTEKNQWEMLDFIQPRNNVITRPSRAGQVQLTLVRHAESTGNVEKIFQGQSETSLTELGEQQARALGLHFSKGQYQFDGIFSSPQLRAVKTAEIICESNGQRFETSDLLKEINNGNLAGLKVEEIETLLPKRTDRSNPYLPVGENGESWLELYLRGMNVVELVISHPPGKYLVVSHGAILNAVVWSILGIPPQPSRRTSIFRFKNTGYCEMVYSPSENLWRFLSLNPETQTNGLEK